MTGPANSNRDGGVPPRPRPDGSHDDIDPATGRFVFIPPNDDNGEADYSWGVGERIIISAEPTHRAEPDLPPVVDRMAVAGGLLLGIALTIFASAVLAAASGWLFEFAADRLGF